jgi:hypothetical protein
MTIGLCALQNQSGHFGDNRRHVPLSGIEFDSCAFIPQPSSYTDHAIPAVRWGSVLRIYSMGQRHLRRNPRHPKSAQQHTLMATQYTKTCNRVPLHFFHGIVCLAKKWDILADKARGPSTLSSFTFICNVFIWPFQNKTTEYFSDNYINITFSPKEKYIAFTCKLKSHIILNVGSFLTDATTTAGKLSKQS